MHPKSIWVVVLCNLQLSQITNVHYILLYKKSLRLNIIILLLNVIDLCTLFL